MGTKLKCKLCNDIIEGDRLGHLISCKCGATAIDETPYYFRILGEPKNILIYDKNLKTFKSLLESSDNALKLKADRVDKINYYLNIAETTAQRSTCLKRHYGSIIVKNDEIISSGYNGAPRGLKSCLDEGVCHRANASRGTDYANCKACHSEQNAIISASRQEMIGSTLYLVGKLVEDFAETDYVENPAPCSLCKRLIINAGIEKVIVRINKTEYKIYNIADWTEEDIIGGY